MGDLPRGWVRNLAHPFIFRRSMAKIYSEAEAVASIAGGLIPNYHPELATARFLFAFANKGWSKGGRDVDGKVRKVSGLLEWALEKDFVMEVALDKWNDMTDHQRTALVDHLLERCMGEEDENSGEMKWSIREPDVQEFTTILERHGAWHSGLNGLVSVAQRIQVDLVEEGEVEDELEHITSTETD
jgi:hypothetical protein